MRTAHLWPLDLELVFLLPCSEACRWGLSSQSRDQTYAPCSGSTVSSPWTTREVPRSGVLNSGLGFWSSWNQLNFTVFFSLCARLKLTQSKKKKRLRDISLNFQCDSRSSVILKCQCPWSITFPGCLLFLLPPFQRLVRKWSSSSQTGHQGFWKFLLLETVSMSIWKRLIHQIITSIPPSPPSPPRKEFSRCTLSGRLLGEIRWESCHDSVTHASWHSFEPSYLPNWCK